MTSWKWLLAGLLVAPVLAGCVVSQTRSGQINFGFMDPGTTVAQFQSANGAVRLRKHFDGTWGLRFSDKLTVYKIGKADDIRLLSEHTVGGKTAALLQRRRGNCTDYELLTITDGAVGRNAIQPGCQTPIEHGVVDGKLVVREAVGERPRFWVWSNQGLQRGREASRPRQAAKPAPRPAPKQPETRTTPAAPARPTAARPAPRAAAPAPRVVLPSGSIQTETVAPTRVVLEREG